MDTLIAMQDIRNGLAAIADRAEGGESFIVVRNSRPAFRIAPLTTPPKAPRGRPPTVDEVREHFETYPVTEEELTPDELDAVIREVRKRGAPPALP
jgi:antitoxin (DNA-binding transcriptional repressor) of toxin-antitoxin stability system